MAAQSHSPAVMLLSSGLRRGPLCVCGRTNRPAYVRQRTEVVAAEGNTSGCAYVGAAIVPRMYATAQTLLRRSVILGSVKRYGNAIVQNVSVRIDMGSADSIDGFLDQIERVSK